MPGRGEIVVKMMIAGFDIRGAALSEFRRGFFATAPIWPGVALFGGTFAVTAVASGFSASETQALSMLVFAGAAQVAATTMFAGSAGVLAITLTVFIMNLRHVLYALSLSRQTLSQSSLPRPLLAFFLTDESYGVTTRDRLDGGGGDAFYFGSSLSLYAIFTLATLGGVLLGPFLPSPEAVGLDFVFTLLFLMLLVPLVRSRRQLLVAGVAGFSAYLLHQFVDGGTTVLLATILAAALGAWIETD